MAEKVWVINEQTDLKELVPAHWLKHPTLGKHLREVRTGKPVLRLTEPAIDKATQTLPENEPDEAPKPSRRNKKED